MKNLKYILCTLTLSFILNVSAQQDPHFSLYRYNMNAINPAFAGIEGSLQGTMSYRSQWSNIPGAAETQNYNINGAVGEKVGLGMTVVQDRIFVLSETHIYADFSYKIQVGDNTNVYAGIKAGGSLLNINLRSLGVENDPLFSENVDTFSPNIGIGAVLKGENYYITASVPGLLKNERYEKEGITPVQGVDNVHFFVGGGYTFQLSDKFDLQPSVLAKAVSGVPLSVDVNAAVMYNDAIEFGLNYRLEESFTGFATFKVLESFRLGYAYERVTTDVADFSGGSHEFILRVQLD